jgi:hypothetical protein
MEAAENELSAATAAAAAAAADNANNTNAAATGGGAPSSAAGTGASVGRRIEVRHLERVLPQILLDF